VVLDRPPRLTEGSPDVAQIAERGALAAPVADLACYLELLIIEVDRPPRLAQVRPDDAQIAERGTLAQPVADLARDREDLLV
jgi:hypothetical protein